MKHLLVELSHGIEDWPKNDVIQRTLEAACLVAGAKVIDVYEYAWKPHGYTAVALLGESHASVHTWPETGRLYVDYFTCSEDPKCEAFVGRWIEKGYDLVASKVIIR